MMLTRQSIIALVATIVIGGVVGSILPGFVYNQFHLFGGFLYEVFFIALAILVLLGLFLDFLIKPKFKILSSLCLCLLLCTLIVTSKLVLVIARRNAVHLAESMIQKINKYQHEHGYYPGSIDSLQTEMSDIDRFKKSLSYRLLTDSTFKVLAWNDGWYDYVYYSKDRSWRKVD